MIYGIGTDIVAVARFQRFLDDGKTTLLERLFSPRERDVCSARKDAASCLAARFAAKEAFLKALGTGLSNRISWHDMEVRNEPSGKPELLVTGRANELLLENGVERVFLSLSHDGGHAVAMVVLEVP